MPEPASLYAGLFEVLPRAIVLVDDQLTVRMANRAAGLLLEAPPRKLSGAPLSALLPYKDLSRLILQPGEQAVKIIELHPEPGQPSQLAKILKLTVVRPKLDRAQDWRLLVLEDVSERVLLENQLVETEKLAGMAQLAHGIAHELANPLNSIGSNLQFIRRQVKSSPAWLEALDSTLGILDQMRRLLRALSEFTEQREPQYEAVDLTRLVRRSLIFIHKEAEAHGIEIVPRFADPLPLCQLDPWAISQVLLNVLKNAIEAMPEGGRLTVTTRAGISRLDGGEAALVEIQDTGAGIDEADMRRVFRPLFTTKPGGTGLGLPFCRQVVEEHGGEVRLNSRLAQGTTVTLVLPLVQQEAEPVEPAPVEAAGAVPKQRREWAREAGP